MKTYAEVMAEGMQQAPIQSDSKRIEAELREVMYQHYHAGVHPAIIKAALVNVTYDRILLVDQHGNPIDL